MTLPHCPDGLADNLDNWRRWLILLPDPRPQISALCASLEREYASHPSRDQFEPKPLRVVCDWREGERTHEVLKTLPHTRKLLVWRRHTVEGWQTVTEDDLRVDLKRHGVRLKHAGQELDAAYNRLLVLL